MPYPNTRGALIALAAAAPLALGPVLAQEQESETEAEAAPAETEPAATTPQYQSGPKRIAAPKSEPAPEPEADQEAEILPEAEPRQAAAADEPVDDILPEAEGAGADEADILPEAEGLEAGVEPDVLPEAQTLDDPDESVAMRDAEPAAESGPEAGTVLVSEDAPAGNEPFVGDYTIGDPDAPVQVIEYASFTCPHCAAFHQQTWPQFKEEYVDTGKVGFTLREVYFDRFGLWASMTARCGGEAGFYPMADQFLKKQREWANAEDPGAAIQQIGKLNGLTTEQLKVCLENQDYAKLLLEDYQANAEADGVTSTPTFVIDGPEGRETFAGNTPFDEFKARVEAAMPDS